MAIKKTRRLTAKPLGDVLKQNRIDLKPRPNIETLEPAIAGRLSDSAINLISFSVREGNHDPEEVRQILADFVFYTETHRPIPENLLRHLRAAFLEYLQNPKDGGLERAIGTRRKNKRPRTAASEKRDHEIAHEVLRHLLEGSLVDSACATVGEKYHLSSKKIAEKWQSHRDHAVLVERLARDRAAKNGKGQWTESEIARLNKIWK